MSEPKDQKQNGPVGSVLVVGGGVGGVQASLDLADAGYYVYLVEQSPAIGGVMAQLDKTFPTNDCSMCILSPKLVECGRHLNIEIITNAQVKGIAGKPGNFKVSVLKKPSYVDPEKCVACGACAEKCPTKVEDEFNEGFSQRKAIYIPYPQAVPHVYHIDPECCRYITKGKCQLCVKMCKSNAIDFEMKEEVRELPVGAVLLAPGFDEYDASKKQPFGYGRYANVITSIQFERLLSASGPFEGHVKRPSDQAEPKRIAFIQCVGSRDLQYGSGYCSGVCCMYAVKESIIAKEHAPETDITIFYMDMRAYGKGFDAYYEEAQEKHGIRFVASNVSSIKEYPDSKNLLVKYVSDDGKIAEEEFDLVVLSVGLEPPKTSKELAKALDIDLNHYGFCSTKGFTPLTTSKPGIFVTGAFQGPKDIPETVAQSSGAAALASALLTPARGSLAKQKTLPKEQDVSGQPPRIGVFVCHCGINIGSVVDVKSVVEYAKTLPNVVYAEENLYSCSQDTQEKIKELIKEHNLNRVVVASCSPRTHEPLFQETIQEAGLNRYLFELANIRDQCSWVHMNEKEGATEKSKDLVRMAVARSGLTESLKRLTLDLNPSALVVGGGIAGMVSGLNIADQGFKVYLIEKEAELGGMARSIYTTLEGDRVQDFLETLINRVQKHPEITVYCNAELKDVSGFVGNYTTTIALKGKEEPLELKHGAAIIATGAQEYKTGEYGYGKDRHVLTQHDLEGEIFKNSSRLKGIKNVVMIQCVDSRNEEHPYCSRICCSLAIKNALKLKEQRPEVNIYILYRDMRTYGLKEDYYREAREKGIIFIRYDLNTKPEVKFAKGKDEDSIVLIVHDPFLGAKLSIDTDLLVLSVATVPKESNKEISKYFKVPLTKEEFFLEAHVKLRPVDFATDGVFLCGMAHYPKHIEETIAQAYAVGSRAGALLSKGKVEAEANISVVDETRCKGCGLCVEICPYNAITLEDRETKLETLEFNARKASINPASCKGCGSCAATCPVGAISPLHFTTGQLEAMIDQAAFKMEKISNE
ncbi:MAG: CoB--CoM heterodisulfide reductase iron-sulfur subunit A family protein [Deltaproteobacteria bacterium]|nr:CoB--CoM heterodisulfide reductase iron-sulfur subunit A family protein [Deltaproteobacteria bacterium]